MPLAQSGRIPPSSLAVLVTTALFPLSIAAQPGSRGTFSAVAERKGDRIELTIGAREGDRDAVSVEVGLDELRGLTADRLVPTATGPVRFILEREPGTFTFEGTAGRGELRGSYTFVGSGPFVAALRRRGFGRPSDADAARLAVGNVEITLIDELNASGYAQPTMRELVRMGLHGVDIAFVRRFSAAGIRVADATVLTNYLDHGVTPEYVADMRRAGYGDVTPAELVRLKDNGVDPPFVAQLAAVGYNGVSVEDAIRARDHGVDATFAQDFRRAGFFNLTLAELIRLRDHGINAYFASQLRERKGAIPSAEDLVQARQRDQGL